VRETDPFDARVGARRGTRVCSISVLGNWKIVSIAVRSHSPNLGERALIRRRNQNKLSIEIERSNGSGRLYMTARWNVYPIIPISRHFRLGSPMLPANCRSCHSESARTTPGWKRELSTQHFRQKGRNRQNNFVPALPLLVVHDRKK